MKRTSAQLSSVQTTSSNPYFVSMSKILLDQFKITEGQKIWLRFGSERVQVTCKKSPHEEAMIQIPTKLGIAHCFPIKTATYPLSYNIDLQELRLGPIIALLTEKTPNDTRLFGNVTDFSRELYTLCAEQQLPFYLFSLDDIDNHRIHGYVLNLNGIQKVTFPLPDVIYNRISSRNIERSDVCRSFFEQCQDLGIAYFNDHFLSKWETHCILVELDTVAAYLPETLLYDGSDSVGKLIDKHSMVFLKPIHGREGKGIVRIQTHEADRVQLDLSSETTPLKSSLSKSTAIKLFEDLLPKNEYIVQQGIPLLDFEGGKVDFRILCNRNEHGNWRISSTVARVSSQERFVSNLSQGAKTYTSMEMLEHFFDKKTSQQLLRTLYEVAINVSDCISHHAGGIFGELGIDVGIDTNGHPWIIEINTKPSKQYLTGNRTSEIRPSARGVFQFARFLSESTFSSV
ncbi:YheC/YheD family protein [Alkalihalobacillus sp. AL-G]|uniref:YheC/YheD family endospore coat-associated protein n=1 Tax=Alkalihalobacillus sp. AL-G TaxID=2926399 RepID=UPI00272BDEB6|nr:YheC/YheD family protein [Alkalihalobacillus sp. AL-G]WLD94046.1 YheC/YheD family protein [Alkalihalobacillus sp. AL-G]